MIKGAEFSKCHNYRYKLWRIWDNDLPEIAFIGLNPSTANETLNDHTIRRCMGFAERWGYGAMYMVNLFAYRSPYPKHMKLQALPIGRRNDYILIETVRRCQTTVACWGRDGKYLNRSGYIMNDLLCGKEIFCLGMNVDGSPKHPARLANNVKLVRYR